PPVLGAGRTPNQGGPPCDNQSAITKSNSPEWAGAKPIQHRPILTSARGEHDALISRGEESAVGVRHTKQVVCDAGALAVPCNGVGGRQDRAVRSNRCVNTAA